MTIAEILLQDYDTEMKGIRTTSSASPKTNPNSSVMTNPCPWDARRPRLNPSTLRHQYPHHRRTRPRNHKISRHDLRLPRKAPRRLRCPLRRSPHSPRQLQRRAPPEELEDVIGATRSSPTPRALSSIAPCSSTTSSTTAPSSASTSVSTTIPSLRSTAHPPTTEWASKDS